MTLVLPSTHLALLIHGAKNDIEDETHEVIAQLLSDWPDERKADLYALIVESVVATDTLIQMEVKIEAAMAKNEEHFRG